MRHRASGGRKREVEILIHKPSGAGNCGSAAWGKSRVSPASHNSWAKAPSAKRTPPQTPSRQPSLPSLPQTVTNELKQRGQSQALGSCDAAQCRLS
jgi:hypothetical protein